MRKGSGALDFPGGHLVFNTNLNDFIVFSNCIYIAFFSATVDTTSQFHCGFLKTTHFCSRVFSFQQQFVSSVRELTPKRTFGYVFLFRAGNILLHQKPIKQIKHAEFGK